MSNFDTAITYTKNIRNKKGVQIMEDAKVIFNELKRNLSEQEQDLVNMLWKIEDGYMEENKSFEQKYNVTYEKMRDILRGILTKYPNEIKHLNFATCKHLKDSIWIKEGDVLDIRMDIPEEYYDEEKQDSMCSQWVWYYLNDKKFKDYIIDIPVKEIFDDIEDFISVNFKDDTNATEYEVLETEDFGDYQTAKIKVKVIKDV